VDFWELPHLAPAFAAVFLSDDGPGAGVLIGFGGVVLVAALLGDAIEIIEFWGSKLKMRAAAAEKSAQAEEAERDGDSETAARLRRFPDWLAAQRTHPPV
jgi:hypothetical protein